MICQFLENFCEVGYLKQTHIPLKGRVFVSNAQMHEKGQKATIRSLALGSHRKTISEDPRKRR
ncbi:hypothetical protein NEPTK9_001734 [Candidatus Neptunochlamydia vexilliferae]|uniref:Transposase n=1 Tax=Candidatus Neptunichlamydia vexilliferae TaxID=1651774 RepID=A0ABS0B1D0_9BACT|nr:hypothetical protein [Candidatus Neptunochlamydia vexilliferae]